MCAILLIWLSSSSASLQPRVSSVFTLSKLTPGCDSSRVLSGRSIRGRSDSPLPVRRAQKWHWYGFNTSPLYFLGIRGGSFYHSGGDGGYVDNDDYDGDDFGDMDGHASDYLVPPPLHRNDERDASRLDNAFDILPFVGGMGGNLKHSRK